MGRSAAILHCVPSKRFPARQHFQFCPDARLCRAVFYCASNEKPLCIMQSVRDKEKPVPQNCLSPSEPPNLTLRTTCTMHKAQKRKETCFCKSPYLDSGNYLSSRAVSSQVLSAFRGLTSVFGMGTGGTLQLSSPEIVIHFLSSATSKPHRTDLKSRNNYFFSTCSLRFAFARSKFRLADQALDLLVSTSSMCYHTSTDDLSTLSSTRGLTCF